MSYLNFDGINYMYIILIYTKNGSKSVRDETSVWIAVNVS